MTQLRTTIALVASLAVAGVLVGCTDEQPAPAGPDASTVPAPAPAPIPDAAPLPPPAPDAAPVDDGDSLLACSLDEVGPLLECAFTNCAASDGGSFDTSNLLTCAAVACAQEVLGLSPDCQQCLFAAGSSGGDTGALLESCIGGDLGGILGGGGLPGGGGGLPGGGGGLPGGGSFPFP